MPAVRYTAELARILSLPRREEMDREALAREMTALLKTPQGTMTLFPVQAQALYDIVQKRGAVCPIDVGEGKTIISLLAPYVLQANRPLLVLPSGLTEKTKRERERLSEHWRIPDNIEIVAYESLSRHRQSDFLDKYNPDLTVGDEAHKLKYPKQSAVAKRFARFFKEHPEAMAVWLSGTFMRSSFNDFPHIVRWSLKDDAPVPKSDLEVAEWALALDPDVPAHARFEPGALMRFTTPGENARQGFKRHFFNTPGVVAAAGSDVSCSIYVRSHLYPMSGVTDANFRRLRGAWELPDGTQLEESADVWRHARELALGFHLRWDPPAPQEWLDARRDWHAYVRETLSRSRTIDSPEQVEIACDAGMRRDHGPELLAAWREIQASFRPNSVPVWHEEGALEFCAGWMKQGPGVVWTEHVAFAERLSELTGVKYYGAEGLAADGEYIEDAAPGPIIASIDANREGKNLQHKWARCLFTSPPDGADVWQQGIGRFHRKGQTADAVIVDFMLGCREHVNAWRRALASTEAIRDTIGGARQKLLIADKDVPTDEQIAKFVGPKWSQSLSLYT